MLAAKPDIKLLTMTSAVRTNSITGKPIIVIEYVFPVSIMVNRLVGHLSANLIGL